MAGKNHSRMTLAQAEQWFDENYHDLRDAFYEDHTSPAGGLLNATVAGVDGQGHLELRCYYDGYDNDEDAWTWFLDPTNKRFYS